MDVSRASSITVGRGNTHPPAPQSPPGVPAAPSLEPIPAELRYERLNKTARKRLIIAVDFGTTYSAVSYVALNEGEGDGYLPLSRIQSIHGFPDNYHGMANDRMQAEVPTEVLYPLHKHFRKRETALGFPQGEERHVGIDDADVSDDDDDENFQSRSQEDSFYDNNDEDADEAMFDVDNAPSFRWGYGVHNIWAQPATHSSQTQLALSLFKLLLDETETTKDVRNKLELALKILQQRHLKIIEGPVDIIADFLTCLLHHTKTELYRGGFDSNSYHTEMVLCVPAIWTQRACRAMQTAMATAMRRVHFAGADLQNNSIENLFLVSEPEAAAAYVLAAERDVSLGETFVLLDAGGGTVDANTYTVSATAPLRLSHEVVPPGGGLFGSSFLNEEFRKLLKDTLADENYLVQGSQTIDGVVEHILISHFEYRIKRNFDFYTPRQPAISIPVLGLRDNAAKRIRAGCITIPINRLRDIFMPCLNGIGSVMETQILGALQKDCRVEKVLLIGGFAGSKCLRTYLERHLEKINIERDCHIRLVVPRNSPTAVASGAVLRAFNKENGPSRFARSSYGILRSEPYMNHPEHVVYHMPKPDRHDGVPYVKAIDWVLKLGKEVPSRWECQPLQCSHTFDCRPSRRLICREVLYVSDTATMSHYRLRDPRNRDAEVVGSIEADFTFLRDQGLIHAIEPPLDESGRRRVGSRHYKVNYTIVIRVIDRDLSCFAIYDGRIIQKCRINIASAFRPGVK